MIIIDENVDQILVDRLRDKNYDILSIRQDHPGITDRQVVKIAKSKRGLVITEDKDFGELVFSYNIRECSVILLRYSQSEYDRIERNIIRALDYYYKDPGHFFITITSKKIRMRNI